MALGPTRLGLGRRNRIILVAHDAPVQCTSIHAVLLSTSLRTRPVPPCSGRSPGVQGGDRAGARCLCRPPIVLAVHAYHAGFCCGGRTTRPPSFFLPPSPRHPPGSGFVWWPCPTSHDADVLQSSRLLGTPALRLGWRGLSGAKHWPGGGGRARALSSWLRSS